MSLVYRLTFWSMLKEPGEYVSMNKIFMTVKHIFYKRTQIRLNGICWNVVWHLHFPKQTHITIRMHINFHDHCVDSTTKLKDLHWKLSAWTNFVYFISRIFNIWQVGTMSVCSLNRFNVFYLLTQRITVHFGLKSYLIR